MKATALSIARDVYPEIPDDKHGEEFLYGMIVEHTDYPASWDTDDSPELVRQLRVHRQTTLGAFQVVNHLLRHLGRVIWSTLWRQP